MAKGKSNSPSTELAALRAKQAELEADQVERESLAARIEALEIQERERVQAETAAARQAEYDAARAALLDAELATVPVLLNLQTRLHAAQAAASVTGGLAKHNRLAGLVQPVDDIIASLKRVHPELLGLPSWRETANAHRLAALKARIKWLDAKTRMQYTSETVYLRDQYKRALEAARGLLALAEGRVTEVVDEVELTGADLAYLRLTGINPTKRGKAASGDEQAAR